MPILLRWQDSERLNGKCPVRAGIHVLWLYLETADKQQLLDHSVTKTAKKKHERYYIVNPNNYLSCYLQKCYFLTTVGKQQLQRRSVT